MTSLGPRGLSELAQLKNAVRTLQRNAKEQLALEQETQATLDHLNGQMAALRGAFDTLSEVVLDEVDAARDEAAHRCNELERRLDKFEVVTNDVAVEFDLIRRSNEVWTGKERDWAKDNEILKASQARVASWIQQLQRDIMEAKDHVAALREEHSARTLQVSEEAHALRTGWKTNMGALQARLDDVEKLTERAHSRVEDLGQARMGDLELVERAMGTLRQQQARLRGALEEGLGALGADVRAATRRTEQLEGQLGRARVDIDALLAKVAEHASVLVNRIAIVDRLLGATSLDPGALRGGGGGGGGNSSFQ